MKRICVNCGSSMGKTDCYSDMAFQLGQALLENNLELVYGGARVGLMGRVADTILQGGGSVIGVIPESIAKRVSHSGLSELHVVGSMHERKQMMFNLSDGFIVLPGGFGTLEELTEILTWSQLGFHSKPCGLINVNGYFDAFLSFLDNAVSEGFIKQAHKDMLLVADAPENLLMKLRNFRVPKIEKWDEEK